MSQEEVDAFHSVPRLSASKADQIFACPSSYAYAHEAHEFRTAHELGKPPVDEVAETGHLFHELFAKVGYHNSRFHTGNGPVKLRDALQVAQEETGITVEGSDYGFAYQNLRRRNELISTVLESAAKETGNARIVHQSMDNERLFLKEDVDDKFSGQGDVIVIVADAYNRRHLVLSDFKSGWKGSHEPVLTNKQLLSLVVLANQKYGPFESAWVCLHTRANVYKPLEIALYDRETIEKAERVITQKLDRARALVDATSEQKYEASAIGSHCTYCEGQLCCKRMLNEASVFANVLNSYANLLATKPEDMNIDQLVETFTVLEEVRKRADPFLKLQKKVAEAARQLNEKKVPTPGLAFKQGAAVAGFSIEEPSIPKVLEAVRHIDSTIDVEEILACCEISASQVRSLIAKRLGCKEKEVAEKLGDKNVFTESRRAPTVQIASEHIETEQQEPGQITKRSR